MLPLERIAEIAANVAAVEQRIAAACARAGRSRDAVTLIAVTKTFPAEAVDAAVAAGVTDVGENRVQEARDKVPSAKSKPHWHLIGHLQSNKAKDAVRLFDVIHTVDSVPLAQKIGAAAEAVAKTQDVLVQVNVGGEEQKSGIGPDTLAATLDELRGVHGIRIRGLMTIPPHDDDPRRWFRVMRTLHERIGLEHLSMGMSEDFELAIEEGATMVRIGRAIFGAR